MTPTADRARPVRSNQTGCHAHLEALVGRHLRSSYRRPIAAHTRTPFERIAPRLLAARKIILDSGCGVGESTARLARQFPDALVVGVDKSARRLARQPALPTNAVTVRAELKDFWRLCTWAGIRLGRHYLLYPNPWPKSAQVRRRWYASPLLPVLLALGGELEVRSNWALYIEEFARALALAGVPARIETLVVNDPITPFERKYWASGQPLYRCRAALATVTAADSVAPA